MRSTTRPIAFALMSCVSTAIVGSAPAKTLFVPNAAFDPLVDASGTAPFTTLGDESTPSPLGVDYWIVQRDRRMTADWRSALTGAGAELLAVFPDDAVLMRVAERPGGGG